jgi:hypothetical protein
MNDAIETFACFGGRCSVRVSGEDSGGDAAAAADEARRALPSAHATLSRFDPDSELSRLNRDPRREVPASPLLRRLVAGALTAGLRSGGLVDGTGVIQATAVAPTGLLAETLAKSALLAGPERAGSQLPFGGVIVSDAGQVRVFESLAPLAPSGLVA